MVTDLCSGAVRQLISSRPKSAHSTADLGKRRELLANGWINIINRALAVRRAAQYEHTRDLRSHHDTAVTSEFVKTAHGLYSLSPVEQTSSYSTEFQPIQGLLECRPCAVRVIHC